MIRSCVSMWVSLSYVAADLLKQNRSIRSALIAANIRKWHSLILQATCTAERVTFHEGLQKKKARKNLFEIFYL